MMGLSVEERLALLEDQLAAQPGVVPARVYSQDEDDVDPAIRLAELRKERGVLVGEMRRKASPAERREQERRAAGLDAAILDHAPGHEPEHVLAGLLDERANVLN